VLSVEEAVMPVPTMPVWVPMAGMLALVGSLYWAKSAVVQGRSARSAALRFAPLLALAVPVTWACDPDWGKVYFYPVMHRVGSPVAVLTVPAVSHLADLSYLSRTGRCRSPWWHLAEFLVAVPAWVVGWGFFSFWVLGWGWI
jgi:hypothetical protein